MILTGTMSAVNDASAILLLRAGQTVESIITNTGGHDFEVDLEQELDGNLGVRYLTKYVANTTSALWMNDSPRDIRVRLRCTVLDVDPDADTIAWTLQDTIPTQAVGIVCVGSAKAGTTAGWVVAAANNIGKVATLPKAVTAGTLVMRLTRLKIGDRIVGAHLVGSLQGSSTKHTTIIYDLRSLTAAVAGATDASVAALGAAVDVQANTVLSASNTKIYGFDHTVVEGESFYVLITGTTANDDTCTAEIQAVVINVVPASTFG